MGIGEDACERQHNFSSTSAPHGGTEAKESFKRFIDSAQLKHPPWDGGRQKAQDSSGLDPQSSCRSPV